MAVDRARPAQAVENPRQRVFAKPHQRLMRARGRGVQADGEIDIDAFKLRLEFVQPVAMRDHRRIGARVHDLAHPPQHCGKARMDGRLAAGEDEDARVGQDRFKMRDLAKVAGQRRIAAAAQRHRAEAAFGVAGGGDAQRQVPRPALQRGDAMHTLPAVEQIIMQPAVIGVAAADIVFRHPRQQCVKIVGRVVEDARRIEFFVEGRIQRRSGDQLHRGFWRGRSHARLGRRRRHAHRLKYSVRQRRQRLGKHRGGGIGAVARGFRKVRC